MKNLCLILALSFVCMLTNAQSIQKKSRKETRKEKAVQKTLEISELINSRNFSFIPNNATPMSGGTIQLTHTYSVELSGDTIISYLPYYGVAYRAEYGATRSVLDFTQTIENDDLTKNKMGYRIFMNVTNNMDRLTYLFSVSEAGYATLQVSSIFRQPISFYGTVEKKPEKKK